MNNNNQVHPSNGVGFCGMLAILFIALKLLGYINWSWWWVLSPLWIPFVLILFLAIILFIILFIKDRSF